jgi:hypothetical protein
MDVLADLLREMPSELDPRVLLGAAAGIAVLIMEIILARAGKILSKGKKRLDQAKARGHILQGTLEDCWYETKSSESGNTKYVYHAKYSYYANGVKRVKKLITYEGRPAPTITLYYDENPDKVYLEEEVTREGFAGCLILGLPIVVAVAVAMLLGYRG